MASAISMVPESLDDDCSFDLSVAFHIIMDGRVILMNSWFDQFAEKVLRYAEEDVTSEEILQCFCICGLSTHVLRIYCEVSSEL